MAGHRLAGQGPLNEYSLDTVVDVYLFRGLIACVDMGAGQDEAGPAVFGLFNLQLTKAAAIPWRYV
jgi:hypothetical protein